MTQTRPNVLYGDLGIAETNTILRTVVGSGVHGIAIEGTDDHDEMGIFIEPVDFVIGTRAPMDSVIYRTKPEGERSEPGDLDLNYYSLRKYLRLAAKGNPTVLLMLWCPGESIISMTEKGRLLRAHRDDFMSQQAVHRFQGYLHSQHERMMGRGRRSSVPYRPELIEAYGYDTKYAAHALRLAYQGLEIVSQGTLTLPLPDAQREDVLRVKRGEVSLKNVSSQILMLEHEIEHQLTRTRLPKEPNWVAINDFSIDAHLDHWERTRARRA